MNINWFPGHMAKTKRLLSESLKLVDVVIELLDARIPLSSKNPDIEAITASKARLVVMNKSDLADEKVNAMWKKHYNTLGYECIFVDTPAGKGLNEVKNSLRNMLKDKLEQARAKGRISRPIRTMVIGIPNVGKSTFINKIAGKSVTITGDRPGITRCKQWVRVNEEIELLDTPGVLWPKFEDELVGISLASTGAIKDTVFDTVEVCVKLLEILKTNYPQMISARYKLSNLDLSADDLLKLAGKNRGCVISGGEIDLYRISAIILDEFRAGKIGKISLERPDSF